MIQFPNTKDKQFERNNFYTQSISLEVLLFISYYMKKKITKYVHFQMWSDSLYTELRLVELRD